VKTIRLALGFAVLAACAGCASARAPTELADARAAFTRAKIGAPSQVAPEALAEAHRALDLAERTQADDPGSAEARHLAYVAHRKALIAEAKARASLAEIQEAQALEVMTNQRRGRLADAENRAEAFADKAESAARPASQRGAKEALDRLGPFAAVREEPRGVVVRLAGSVLFEGHTAELMPTARERLDRVAEALHAMHATAIAVRGHVDRSGDDRRDVERSRRQAEAVRTYLVSRGVHADRVRADGVGAAEPLTSNASPEGKSDNRRIEIVIHESRATPPGAKQ
jgi:outer membrane protein OmpA-like peptidoglycan-associated protein